MRGINRQLTEVMGIILMFSGIVFGGCPDCLFSSNQEVLRALAGFEQSGASGSPGNQDFLLDLYLSRAAVSPRVRWWGNVEIASFPQQVNSQIASFAPQFSISFGKLAVNQLARSAEFVTGPEFIVSETAHSALALFAGGGATGPDNPADSATVFQIPQTGSPQYATLTRQIGAIPAGSSYVAFLPESNGRFSREWQAGLRLYSSYDSAPEPGSVEFSIGQNEFITSGHLSGLVGHVAATHPFAVGAAQKKITIYLFGEAAIAYTHSPFSTPLILSPALENGSPVPVTNSAVYAVTVAANQRDTYRFGVAMDLVSAIHALIP